MDFPESLNPSEETKLVEKLALGKEEQEYMDYIRRHMRYIYVEERNRQRVEGDPGTQVS